MTRAAIYTRVSTDRQEAEGTSLDSQLERCQAYAAAQGYEVVGHYTDTFTGSSYRNRSSQTALRTLLHAGAVDVVLCYAFDRLSRNQAHLHILIDEIEHHGARPEAVIETLEDSAVGRLMLSVRAFVAEVEREKIIERTSRGRRTRVETGKYLPGWKQPYGYVFSEDRTKLEVNEAEALIVRRIYADYLSGGTLRGIARQLTAEGVPTPAQARSGNPCWELTAVRSILKRTTYIGIVKSHHGEIELTDVAPPLIDRADFEAVQRRMPANRQHATRNARFPEGVALLRAGFVVCGLCGATMMVTKGQPAGKYDYQCRATITGQCSRHSMRTAKLDAAVWEQLRAWMLDDEPLERTKASRHVTDPSLDLAQLDRSMAQLERQRDNLIRTIGLTDDADSSAALIAQLDTVSKQRRALEAERGTVEREAEGYRLSQQVEHDMNGWRQRTAAGMDAMTYQERRDLLSLLGLKVKLWPADHKPRWYAGSELVPSIVLGIA